MSKRAIKKYKPKNFAIVGGASANKRVREEFDKLAKEFNFNLFYPQMKYTSDNAAMIARAGIEMYKNREFINFKELQVYPRVEFNKC